MLKIQNISVSYPDGTMGLECFSYNFEAGRSYALLGANGAGKSTLMKAIMGLLHFDGGSARLDGVEIVRKNLPQIRRLAGLVFQNSDDQLFCASVADDIAFGLLNMGMNAEEAASLALEYGEKFGLGHLFKRSPARLSEGEKKRIALCCVMAMRPKLLMFDEPTAQLDPRSIAEFAETISQLSETRIIATHDLELAKKTCDTALVVKNGKLAASGATCEIINDTKLLIECRLA